jgi:hypothetical protein
MNPMRTVIKTVNLVEGGANTFTAGSVTLASLGITDPEAKKAVLLKAKATTSPLGAASGASTATYTKVQVTKSIQVAQIGVSNTDLLYEKDLEGCSGAAAGTISWQQAHEPLDLFGKNYIPPDRRYLFTKAADAIYYNIQSNGQAAARAVDITLVIQIA